MNILFIAQYYPEQLLAIFKKKTKGGLDFAAHNLHKAIIKGFNENGQIIDIVNAPHLGSFPPYYKTPFIPKYKSKEEHINSFSYLNISYIKRWDIKRKMRKEMFRWCSKIKGEKIIFFYNFTALTVLPELKKKFKDVKACLLVTDLPEYMAADNYFLTRLNRKISSLLSSKDKSHFDYVDGYVLLAPAMTKRLPINGKPWIQIEGIYNPEDDKMDVDKLNEKVILYTGNLGKRYGILDLLEAFHRIDNNEYRLWICGSGDGLEDIQKYAKLDSRITYLGILPRVEVIKLQKQATLLINPRHSADDYTIYSFPSKTMEYIASATPTLMSHLKSIPSEYDKHLFYFEDETIDGFSKRIVDICEKSQEELNNFGAKASEFIMKYKTPKPQIEKIISFIKSL
jgi:glycosyltransferase involved in cell wall biosynthesis